MPPAYVTEAGIYDVEIIGCKVSEAIFGRTVHVTRFLHRGRDLIVVERVVPEQEPAFKEGERLILEVIERRARSGRPFFEYRWHRRHHLAVDTSPRTYGRPCRHFFYDSGTQRCVECGELTGARATGPGDSRVTDNPKDPKKGREK